MKRLLLLCALATMMLLLPTSSSPQVITRYVALGFCQIGSSSLSSAVTLTNTSACAIGVPTGAQMAEICVEVAAVRYRDDGTAPTSSIGVLVAAQSASIPTCFQYSGPLTAIQFIASTGSPVVDVAFYK